MTQTSIETAAPSVREQIPDAACAGAVDLAREAAIATAGAALVGDHVDIAADGDRIVTHFFACTDRAYPDWRWAVTVVRVPRSKVVTVDEVVLLPGVAALLAPAWVPWSERLQPGDLGVGDVMSTAADDERLTPGHAAIGPHDETDDPSTIDALIDELALGRPRVLSEYGRSEAAERWYDGDHGPQAPIARAAELHCASCGFLTLMRGALSRVFGVCANEFAPDDGRVVSFDHGCGAHSDALVLPTEPVATEPGDEPLLELEAVESVAAEPEIMDVAQLEPEFDAADTGEPVDTDQSVDAVDDDQPVYVVDTHESVDAVDTHESVDAVDTDEVDAF